MIEKLLRSLLIITFIYSSAAPILGSIKNIILQDEYRGVKSLQVPNHVKVIDYTGRGAVKLTENGALVPDPEKPVVIVVADELELVNADFNYCESQAPRQVILIADTIRVKGVARFNLGIFDFPYDMDWRCNTPYASWSNPQSFPPNPSIIRNNLGVRLPAVLSIITRKFVLEKDGYVCLDCIESNEIRIGPDVVPRCSRCIRFNNDVVGSGGTGVESADRPTFTIAAEEFDIVGKADTIIDILKKTYTRDPKLGQNIVKDGLEKWALALFLGTYWDEGVEEGEHYIQAEVEPELRDKIINLQWAKPILQEIRTRQISPSLTSKDEELLRQFLRSGFKANPELALFSAISRGDDGDFESSYLPENLNWVFYGGFDGIIDNFVVTRNLSESGRKDPIASIALSLWAVNKYHRLKNELKEAERTDNRTQVLQLLQSFSALPKYEIRPEHRKFFDKAVDELIAIRTRYRNQLWRRSVQLDLPSRAIDIFSEAGSLDTYIAPTQILVNDAVINNRNIIGTVRLVEGSPSRDIELRFTAELGLDPLIAEAVRKKISQNEVLKGQFNNWELSAESIVYEGVKGSNINFTGNTLDITLQLDGQKGTTALYQLVNGIGLPLILNYKYRNDPQQTGRLAAIPLTLAKRQKTNVVVTAQGLRNDGLIPVTVSYLQMPNGSTKILSPEITLQPNETRVIPEVQTVQTGIPGVGSIAILPTVPSGAVKVLAPDFIALNYFENIGGITLSEEIEIENTVPVNRVGRDGSLQYLELNVVYRTSDGREQRLPEPIKILPFPSDGAKKKLTFINLQSGTREILISGRAVYTNNGTDTIPQKRFNTNKITIDSTTLSSNP